METVLKNYNWGGWRTINFLKCSKADGSHHSEDMYEHCVMAGSYEGFCIAIYSFLKPTTFSVIVFSVHNLMQYRGYSFMYVTTIHTISYFLCINGTKSISNIHLYIFF